MHSALAFLSKHLLRTLKAGGLVVALVLAGTTVQAQQLVPGDTVVVTTSPVTTPAATNVVPTVASPRQRLYPRRAALLSAVLPGAGQIYNRKYWKLPILYGGIGALIYFYNFNDTEYRTFKRAYILRYQGDATSASLADRYPDIRQLSVGRDYYRRNRDFTVILMAALYAINIVDALVDAHLSEFSVSDDLSLSVAPSVQMPVGMATRPSTGLSLTFTLK